MGICETYFLCLTLCRHFQERGCVAEDVEFLEKPMEDARSSVLLGELKYHP